MGAVRFRSREQQTRSVMSGEKNEESYLEQEVADIVTSRGHEFRVGEEYYRLWPVTLGKMLLLRPYLVALGIGQSAKEVPVYQVILDHVKKERVMCATILAIHTIDNSRQSMADGNLLRRRTAFFESTIDDVDLASLLAMTLSDDRTEAVSRYLGLDVERERLHQVLKVKKMRNTLNLGGKSVFGGFVASLKKLGFTIDEIVWECSYSFLRLVLMDEPVSMYLSDEELSQLGGNVGGIVDSSAADYDLQIKAFAANHGIKIEE